MDALGSFWVPASCSLQLPTAGYDVQRFVQAALDDVAGPLSNASLTWQASARPATFAVAMAASTSFQPISFAPTPPVSPVGKHLLQYPVSAAELAAQAENDLEMNEWVPMLADPADLSPDPPFIAPPSGPDPPPGELRLEVC